MVKKKKVDLLQQRRRLLSATKSVVCEQLIEFQTDLGLSNRKTRFLAQDLKVVTSSRKGMEQGFKESLTKNSHTVDGYFKR